MTSLVFFVDVFLSLSAYLHVCVSIYLATLYWQNMWSLDRSHQMLAEHPIINFVSTLQLL